MPTTRMRRSNVYSALLIILTAAPATGQSTWYVDDDVCPAVGARTVDDPFCSIQHASNAASDGDTIIVAPRVYYEAIPFNGVAVRSCSSEGASVTRIDASGLNDTVVTCVSREGPATILEGFRITGRHATYGAGMLTVSSSPTVTNCVFTGNTCPQFRPGWPHA